MSLFEIHPQLCADCHRLGRLELCQLLLHRNAAVPWFILVPETEVQDLLDLPEAQRHGALAEAHMVANFVKRELGYPKVNFAAIGNVVPQLHLHVVGRKPGDACWPAPVWGHLNAKAEYSTARIAELSAALARSCSLRSL
jgi:diadenosine tetraphosphate (Ap4A) HIT family hydrolase